MRLAAALASLAVLALYLVLMPLYGFALMQPRGGMVMLGFSLAVANGMVWQSANPRWSLSARFQLAAAGWIWILVQAGGLAYLRWVELSDV